MLAFGTRIRMPIFQNVVPTEGKGEITEKSNDGSQSMSHGMQVRVRSVGANGSGHGSWSTSVEVSTPGRRRMAANPASGSGSSQSLSSLSDISSRQRKKPTAVPEQKGPSSAHGQFKQSGEAMLADCAKLASSNYLEPVIPNMILCLSIFEQS